MPKYIGMDVHKQTCHATVMDEQGNVFMQEKFLNERKNSRGSSKISSMQRLR